MKINELLFFVFRQEGDLNRLYYFSKVVRCLSWMPIIQYARRKIRVGLGTEQVSELPNLTLYAILLLQFLLL